MGKEKYICRCSRRTLVEVANNCMGHEPDVVQEKGQVNECTNDEITINTEIWGWEEILWG